MSERTLTEVAAKNGLVGGPFGSNLVGTDYVASGVPVIRGSNMLNRYIGGEFAFVTPEKYRADLERNTAVCGDLIFTQRGTLGQVAMVPSGGFKEYVVSQSQMRLRVDPLSADPQFVYYACKRPEFLKQISDNAISTGVPHINLGILGRLTIPDYPVNYQAAIAGVLSSLDDKIAANDQLAGVVDDLLSTRFAQMSMGASMTGLRSLATVNQQSTKPAVAGTLRYLDISSVGRGRYDLPPESEWASAPSRARRVISRGDVVWSTVRPNRRSHALVLDHEELIGSTGLAVLTPHPGRTATVYEAVRTDRFVAFLEAAAEGSAYPAVRADRFLDAPIPELEPDDMDRFEEVALPLRELVHALTVESRKLAQTRDELLPHLMSGRVRVQDAERLVAGANDVQ